MLADPSVQLRLLDLAALDTTRAQLTHRRRSLPELTVLERTGLDMAGIEDELVELTTSRNDLARETRRLDSDVESVRQRRERDATLMTSGVVTSSKELERLEHEIATLVRRQGELEDQELELMERGEELDAAAGKVESTRATVQSERATAEAARDEQWSAIDAEAATTEQERALVAGELPADLLALYEKLRTGGGPGAAPIQARRCGGCRMELAGSELAAVRNAQPDAVLRCENCRCIQVRTAQSGL